MLYGRFIGRSTRLARLSVRSSIFCFVLSF